MIDGFSLAPIVASIAVLIAVYVFYIVLDEQYLGPEDTFWNDLRPKLLPEFDDFAQDIGFGTVNQAYSEELACTIDADLPTIESTLHEAGYDRNPMAGLKYRGDRADEEYEVTTWAKRESQHSLIPDPLAFWQTHAFVFENENGSHDVYAHYEYSSMNPLVAYQHVRAIDLDAERGVQEVRKDLRC